MWKDFFYYSKTEKRTIILLLVLLVPAVVVYILPLSLFTDETHDDENSLEAYNDFIETLTIDTLSSVKRRYSYASNRVKPILQPFDPNRIDSAAFVRLGLPPWMARNIMRYRNKGGVFRTAESFSKVYGLSDEEYQILLPYITIQLDEVDNDSVSLLYSVTNRDSLYPEKYEKGVVIDLNSADTTELKKIPGIGSYIANRIIMHRIKLGGYYAISQLEELKIKSEMLTEWFSIDLEKIQPVYVNKWSIERLKAHPYINFYQAKVMVEHRRKRGVINGINELEMYEEFDEKSINRLKPYLNFSP